MSFSGGDINKKVKRFAKISDYLAIHEKDLYDLYDTAGLMGKLVPRHGTGMTLIVPPAAEIKRLKAMQESDKGDEPESVTDELESLILHVHLKSADDFIRHRENLPNMHGKTLVVIDKKDKAVEVKGHDDKPVKLSMNDSFKPLGRVGNSTRGNLAIWEASGRIKTDTPDAKSVPMEKSGGGKRRKQKHVGGGKDATTAKLLDDVIQAKLAAVARGPVNGVEPCPLSDAVAAVLQGWSQLDGDEYKVALAKARCLLSGQATIDFFKIMGNPLVFSADIVEEGLKKGSGVLASACIIDDFLKSAGSGDYLLATAKGRQEVGRLLDNRSDDWCSGNASQFCRALEGFYNELDLKNTISGKGPVYCKEMASVFSQFPGLHEVLDEVAMKVWCYLREMVSKQDRAPDRAGFRHQSYAEIFNSFREQFGPSGVNLPTGGTMTRRCVFTKSITYMGSNNIPEAAKCFAKCCAGRCHCGLVVKGAGKKDDDDSDSEDEHEPTGADEMASDMQAIKAEEAPAKQSVSDRIDEIVRLASGLSKDERKDLIKKIELLD